MTNLIDVTPFWTPAMGQFVDPEVSELAQTAPASCWPFRLFDPTRRQWFKFATPADVAAATLPDSGQQLDLLATSQATAGGGEGGGGHRYYSI